MLFSSVSLPNRCSCNFRSKSIKVILQIIQRRIRRPALPEIPGNSRPPTSRSAPKGWLSQEKRAQEARPPGEVRLGPKIGSLDAHSGSPLCPQEQRKKGVGRALPPTPSSLGTCRHGRAWLPVHPAHQEPGVHFQTISATLTGFGIRPSLAKRSATACWLLMTTSSIGTTR